MVRIAMKMENETQLSFPHAQNAMLDCMPSAFRKNLDSYHTLELDRYRFIMMNRNILPIEISADNSFFKIPYGIHNQNERKLG